VTPRVEDNIRSEGIIKIDAEGLLFLHTFILLGRKPSLRRAPSNFISGRALSWCNDFHFLSDATYVRFSHESWSCHAYV